MEEKIESQIVKIDLNSATFSGGRESVKPTFINFFFGNNGTGKTTIARAIRNNDGITYANGCRREDYNVLVFNQDYIDANFQNYHYLKGVFTVNEVNIKIQEQIDELNTQLINARKALNEASQNKKNYEEEKEALRKALNLQCWRSTEKLRETFKATQEGKKRADVFVQELLKHTGKEYKLDELKRMYDSIYSLEAKKYEKFFVINDISAFDELSIELFGIDILGLSVVNTSTTPFASFLREVGSTEWVRQGHKAYHDKSGNCCPYCSQKLPNDFEEMLKESFDNQYQKNIACLKELLVNYQQKSDALLAQLSNIPKNIYPEVEPYLKDYNEKVNLLRATFTSNIGVIKSKLSEPSMICALDETWIILKDIIKIVETINGMIDANNEIVAAKEQKKSECTQMVFDFLAYYLKDAFITYKKEDTRLESIIQKTKYDIKEQNNIIEDLKNRIRVLNFKTVETETAMNNINGILRDTGFAGFEVRPKRAQIVTTDGIVETAVMSPAVNYEVVRTDTGQVATDLSEGEKNFLAFLYYQQNVFGTDSPDGDIKNKIIVIDDPVSSMDSGALFIVSALVRKMIEICRNNVYGNNRTVSGSFIKQIFVLTHNVYFHREVTYAFENDWEAVAFFHVRKIENRSYVQLCVQQDPNAPSVTINRNPVKNSYWALWEEYKEVKTCIPLISVIRRILEYYFLQLTGYGGGLLRETILEMNRNRFIVVDDNGKEDTTKYDMASAMLSYLYVNTAGFNDGIYYVDDGMDIEMCRETFKQIFECMGQEQHYDMMMKSSGGIASGN